MLGVNLVYFCGRKQKKFFKNKKSLFILPFPKKRDVSKSILKDFSIENISNNSYEFFVKQTI